MTDDNDRDIIFFTDYPKIIFFLLESFVRGAMDFEDTGQAKEILAELNRQRTATPELCDFRLVVQGHHIPAHRCVLAACSSYFRALFAGSFDDAHGAVCVIPDSSHSVAFSVVDYIYSGKIQILHRDVEEILSVADYFCLERLTTHCVHFMRMNITEDNCLSIKYLAERFSLKELSNELTDYIAPRFSRILTNIEATMALPFDFLTYLFQNPNFNHVNEQQIFNFLMQWVDHDYPHRQAHIKDIHLCLEVHYLPPRFIQDILNIESGAFSSLDDDLKTTLRKQAEESTQRGSLDAIFCRSRSVTIGQEVQLLCYLPGEDSWHTIATPGEHILDGLESLVNHLDSIYFLVSKTEDMYGYMHHTQDTKYFWQLNLSNCSWEQLTAPTLVRGHCRLLSHVSGVYVIDKSGLVEEFDTLTGHWAALNERGYFENANTTSYILPMMFDRYLYILRVFSSGYAFCYSQLSFSLHKIDTVRRLCELLSEIEACDVDICDHEKLHGYVATHESLTMSNELGQPRLKFQFVEKEWLTIIPRKTIPEFITDVWGSAKIAGRVYFVGKSKIETPIFMMYDCERDRFKATVAPPTYLSGLMCPVSLSRTAWAKFTCV